MTDSTAEKLYIFIKFILKKVYQEEDIFKKKKAERKDENIWQPKKWKIKKYTEIGIFFN